MALNVNKCEKRFVVRIKTGEKPKQKQVYFRNAMTFEFYKRWKWFFEYRAALLKVQSPKLNVELSMSSYDYELPRKVYIERLKNLIRARKSTLTKYKNRIARVKKEYKETTLFPIKNDPKYPEVEAKLKRLEKELAQAKQQLNKLYVTNHKVDNDVKFCGPNEILNKY
jgi:hypothetical protein